MYNATLQHLQNSNPSPLLALNVADMRFLVLKPPPSVSNFFASKWSISPVLSSTVDTTPMTYAKRHRTPRSNQAKHFSNDMNRCGQERNEGWKIPRATNHYGSTEWLRGAPKSPNNVTSTFFNTVHLLWKELRFEHGGAKLASCPGRHLTSLRPWVWISRNRLESKR